jgi:rhamnosyltransferase subunit B
MKIVISTFGSLGDIYPYIEMGKILTKYGHQVKIATCKNYEDLVLTQGMQHCELRPDFDFGKKELLKKAMTLKDGSKVIVKDIILPHIKESYLDLTKIIEGCDLLINHAYCYAGPIVAEEQKIKWISCNLSPTNFWSSIDPCVLPHSKFTFKIPSMGFRINFLLNKFIRLYTKSWCSKIYDLRKQINLPTIKQPLFEGQHSPYAVLALFSHLFASKQEDWPINSVTTGFLSLKSENKIDDFEDVKKFLEKGDSPIVVGLGSSVIINPEGIYDKIICIANKLKKRIILVGGKHKYDKKIVSSNIILTDFIPYDVIFPYASLIVHHGGIGTTFEAMKAGRPMLVIPHSGDQPDNALRIIKLGVGDVLFEDELSSNKIEDKIIELLQNKDYENKAIILSTELKKEKPEEKIITIINSLNKNS